MSDHVKVEDIEVFSRFRVAMLKFAHAAGNALSSADTEIARTRSWLETEQRTYWEGQLRKRMEAVTQARETLRQKKLYKDASGRTPGVTEEEKALARCLAAVEQARERIESIRKWLPRLEKAAGHYHGGVAPLGKVVNDDIPRAVALLDRLAASLEDYVQMESAVGGGGMSEPMPEDAGEAVMSRGGELSAAESAVVDSPLPSEGSAVQPPTEKEGRDVADGQ